MSEFIGWADEMIVIFFIILGGGALLAVAIWAGHALRGYVRAQSRNAQRQLRLEPARHELYHADLTDANCLGADLTDVT